MKTRGLLGLLLASALFFSFSSGTVWAAQTEREPVILKVVAVNPSSDKTKTVPVRIDLPAEVTPNDVLDKGELSVEFDDERGIYYVFKGGVELAPKETRVFQVVVRDLWFVPDDKLEGLKNYTSVLLGRLKGTPYFDSAKRIGDSALARLDEIAAQQSDEGLSRKTRIGNFRRHTLALDQIKEDLSRMEKLLSFTGGPPVPEMMKESKLKSDAPSRTTTWAVIFLILLFLGLLGGQFFFTWHQRMKATQDVAAIRESAFSILQGKKEEHAEAPEPKAEAPEAHPTEKRP